MFAQNIESLYCCWIATLLPHEGVDGTERGLRLHKVLDCVTDGDDERQDDTGEVDVFRDGVIDALNGQGKLDEKHPAMF